MVCNRRINKGSWGNSSVGLVELPAYPVPGRWKLNRLTNFVELGPDSNNPRMLGVLSEGGRVEGRKDNPPSLYVQAL